MNKDMFRIWHVLNYDYAGKYMIEALGRRDGTSKFHPDYRWCNFGAASIGWRISEESFIKDNLKWLDNLKLRASFGITGGAVSELGNYDYLSSIALGTTYFNTGLVQKCMAFQTNRLYTYMGEIRES